MSKARELLNSMNEKKTPPSLEWWKQNAEGSVGTALKSMGKGLWTIMDAMSKTKEKALVKDFHRVAGKLNEVEEVYDEFIKALDTAIKKQK